MTYTKAKKNSEYLKKATKVRRKKRVSQPVTKKAVRMNELNVN